MKLFKIRCSAIGSIMGNMTGGVTDKQQEELTKLLAKPKEGKGSLTAKMAEKIIELTEKKESPRGLPKTCITYLEDWVKEQVYGRRSEIKSKYLTKGNVCEDEAIEMLIGYYGLGFMGYKEKNEQFFEDDFLTGTPDLIYPDRVFDTKCSFDSGTFPLFVNKQMIDYDKNYWWQGQGYMSLTKPTEFFLPAVHSEYSVVYALCNTPDDIVEREVSYGIKYAKDKGKVEAEIRARHNFDDIPIELRLKRFDFSFDAQAIAAVHDRVKLCRQYIADELLPMVKC